MIIRTLALTFVLAAGQTPQTGQPQKPAPPAPAAPAAEQPAPQAAYSYEPGDRRDPFVSLLSASDPRSVASRPPGVAGMLIGEVRVKGIIRDRSGFIAMIQGADTKTFIVRTGQKLMDGSVKSITADAVVFSQDVNDPLSVVKQREVRVQVRPGEGRG